MIEVIEFFQKVNLLSQWILILTLFWAALYAVIILCQLWCCALGFVDDSEPPLNPMHKVLIRLLFGEAQYNKYLKGLGGLDICNNSRLEYAGEMHGKLILYVIFSYIAIATTYTFTKLVLLTTLCIGGLFLLRSVRRLSKKLGLYKSAMEEHINDKSLHKVKK